MKKQCGYLDQHGGFHRTKREASDANIHLRISYLYRTMEDLRTKYSKMFSEPFEGVSQEFFQANIENLTEKVILKMLRGNDLKEAYDTVQELRDEEKNLRMLLNTPNIFRADAWQRKILTFHIGDEESFNE